MHSNIDLQTVRDFGEEWGTYDQTALTRDELGRQFQSYFRIFPWNELPSGAVGFDLGCGSGRWAKCVAPRVGLLHCIDPSEKALEVAHRSLDGLDNCEFHAASVDAIPLDDASMDFGYSLGVLHHVPDTAAGISACAAKLKPGAPLLVYLYYAFDNRPAWYQALWRLSDSLRRVTCALPHPAKLAITLPIAALCYWPIARLALLLERAGVNVSNLPLSGYRDRSFYSMRTDALDRFGTRLEHRFTRRQIKAMMEAAGLERIQFSAELPFWCALGFRRDAEGIRRR
jgi:ubiquinone/menaquinone biosynthesis C-methylase UbiE